MLPSFFFFLLHSISFCFILLTTNPKQNTALFVIAYLAFRQAFKEYSEKAKNWQMCFKKQTKKFYGKKKSMPIHVHQINKVKLKLHLVKSKIMSLVKCKRATIIITYAYSTYSSMKYSIQQMYKYKINFISFIYETFT